MSIGDWSVFRLMDDILSPLVPGKTKVAVTVDKVDHKVEHIRAPWVEEVGPGVEVLAEVDGRPVLAREGRYLVAAFHPELTDDTRLHEQFLDLVREEQGVRA